MFHKIGVRSATRFVSENLVFGRDKNVAPINFVILNHLANLTISSTSYWGMLFFYFYTTEYFNLNKYEKLVSNIKETFTILSITLLSNIDR